MDMATQRKVGFLTCITFIENDIYGKLLSNFSIIHPVRLHFNETFTRSVFVFHVNFVWNPIRCVSDWNVLV